MRTEQDDEAVADALDEAIEFEDAPPAWQMKDQTDRSDRTD